MSDPQMGLRTLTPTSFTLLIFVFEFRIPRPFPFFTCGPQSTTPSPSRPSTSVSERLGPVPFEGPPPRDVDPEFLTPTKLRRPPWSFLEGYGSYVRCHSPKSGSRLKRPSFDPSTPPLPVCLSPHPFTNLE